MIGDPRDAGERTLNTADTVAEWAERIRGQLERFVDFDGSPTGADRREQPRRGRARLSAIEFLRDIGKHFSVNVMLDRDTVRRRAGGRGDLLHRVQLHAVAGQRLRRTAPAARLHAADRRLRPVGQHHRRRPAGPPEARRDRARADRSAGDRRRRHQVRQVDRRRQPVAGPADDQPVRLVPVLHQHRRRRRHPLSAVVHLPVGRRAGRAGAGDAERPHERAAQRRLARELTTLVHGEAATDAVEHASRRCSAGGNWPARRADAGGGVAGERRWPN